MKIVVKSRIRRSQAVRLYSVFKVQPACIENQNEKQSNTGCYSV